MKARAYIDGSGNSGRIQAAAAVLYTSDGNRYERTVILPPHTTNNVGEYNGAILAVELAKEYGVEDLEILSDSQLIVNQLNGDWRAKEKPLRELRNRIWEAARVFHSISLQWIPRKENAEADLLCRRAIREGEKEAERDKNPFMQSRA